jgi:hypothetical protein
MIQCQRNKLHDKFIKKKKLKVVDWALLFDSSFKVFIGNALDGSGLMRFIVYDNGAIKICTIDDERNPLMENVHRL